MKKIISLLLCAALVLSLLAGCSSDSSGTLLGGGLDPEETQVSTSAAEEIATAEVSLAYDPTDSFNPFKATGYTNRAIFSLIYQGLFSVNSEYQATPILCKSYNISADQRTYTFYLQSATFSDGTAVTANDVAASLTAAKESSWYGSRLLHVTSITGYGDAVVVELDTPMENLTILLDVPVLKASEVNADYPLGSGPYQLSGNQLRRQAGWWCSAQLPVEDDTIDLYAGKSAAEIRDLFEFDHLSLVCTDPSSTSYVQFHSDYELWDYENGLFLYLVVHGDSYFFSNSTIRAALTHAIDRDALVSSFYNGFAYSATLPASPQSPFYSNSLAKNYTYDPDRFKEALGSTDYSATPLTMLVRENAPQRVKIANAIADQLAQYGLNVEVTEVSSDDYAYLLATGEYDLYLAETRLSANMDLSAFFSSSGALRLGGLADPATYATCLEALQDSDNYFTLHEMIMENGWLCPLLFQSGAIYTQRGVLSNFSPARDNVFYYELSQ